MSSHAKLGLLALVIAGATAQLAYVGASTSWQYYVLVDECVQSQNTFVGQRLRVSGRVAKGSLHIHDDRRLATFVMRGQQSEIAVSCRGPLPDNLAEDIDVVVEGTLDNCSQLSGEKVMTRCASKYQSEQPAT